MRFRRCLSLAALSAALVAPACTTVIVEKDGAAGGPPGLEPGDPKPGDPAPACTVDPADVVDIRAVESASFIEYALHVEGSVESSHGYAVLDIVEEGVAELVEVRPDLVGGASWTQFASVVPQHLYARVRGTALDVMLGSGDGAELMTTTDLGVPLVPGAEGIAITPGGLHLCLATGESPPRLHRFDTFDLLHPLDSGPSDPCEVYGGRAKASGDLWVDTGDSDVHFRRVGTNVSQGHGWAPDGVHAYGGVTAVETDGHVVAVTLENDAYAFLYYTNASEQFVVYSSFGTGDKKLLAVNSGRAIVALPDPAGARIVSYQLDPPPPWEEAAPRGDLDALIRGAAGFADLEMLAHDGSFAVLSDGENLFAVSIWGESENEPLVVVRPGASIVCE